MSDLQAGQTLDHGNQPGDKRGQTAMAVIFVLLAGALGIVGVARSGSSGGDLPPLPTAGQANETAITTLSAVLPESVADGVAAPATAAPAYRIETRTDGEVPLAIRAALGLTGEVTSDESGFTFTDSGSDRILQVQAAPGSPWSLYRGDVSCLDRDDAAVSSDGQISCAPSGIGTVEPDVAGGSGQSEELRCPPVECPEGQACAQVCPEPAPLPVPEPGPAPQPAPAPTPVVLVPPAEAQSRAESILQAIGIRPLRTTVQTSFDGNAWEVISEMDVDGVQILGFETRLLIGEGGEVVGGNGFVMDPALLGDYPLLTAEGALERLKSTTAAFDPLPLPAPDGSESAIDPALDSRSQGSVSGLFGEDLPPTQVINIRLALTLYPHPTNPGGSAFLVPTYQLDATDGATFSVPAVTDEHLIT